MSLHDSQWLSEEENVRLTHQVYIFFFYLLKGNWRLGATAFGLYLFVFLIGSALGLGMGR